MRKSVTYIFIILFSNSTLLAQDSLDTEYTILDILITQLNNKDTVVDFLKEHFNTKEMDTSNLYVFDKRLILETKKYVDTIRDAYLTEIRYKYDGYSREKTDAILGIYICLEDSIIMGEIFPKRFITVSNKKEDIKSKVNLKDFKAYRLFAPSIFFRYYVKERKLVYTCYLR